MAGSPRCATSPSSPAPSSSRRPSTYPPPRSRRTSPCHFRRDARASARAAQRSSSQRAGRSSPGRCMARRESSPPTATCAPVCARSGGSTQPATTAARTCWRHRFGRRRPIPLPAAATASSPPRRADPRRGVWKDGPVRYPVESFSDEERRLLAPHFTNLDRPVFCLVNLPETVKGALFARYSRYGGTLRRLYLEEFAAEVPEGGRPLDGVEGERAARLYERVFLGYGDDSIAQVGGAHLACEWASNLLTKLLQRGRLAAYLEQSTRYIAYDRPIPGGGYRYYADDELGPDYGAAMDELFTIYSASLERVQAWAAERWPRGADEPEGAWNRSIRAKALDLLRGLLPASTLSHVGIFASGQAYEQL